MSRWARVKFPPAILAFLLSFPHARTCGGEPVNYEPDTELRCSLCLYHYCGERLRANAEFDHGAIQWYDGHKYFELAMHEPNHTGHGSQLE